eukprot:CAMPEP_0182464438 /NCGR_PEP_ID=MMETSP1319-20130603/8646_1 /TAXON_ID=172717 /ORGANISM="Bolidomonas pacifica, Strain RCC208" /LENGTH=437 /DNA_ID=CAMNT_0024664081 /DNA_START=83 /DNA_END=1396 /DNA_ORIENTATION=-
MCKPSLLEAKVDLLRRPLVPNAGIVKSIFVMAFCHLGVCMLCVNVLFDLFVLGIPAYTIAIFSTKLFRAYTTWLINFTTPIVFNLPMGWSGTKVYMSDPGLLARAKADNALLLANHGSRIDWMIGMYVSWITKLSAHDCARKRVGFVCEGIIQFMPLIGWYRKLICEDVFVMRSFKQDAATIRNNCNSFHDAKCKRLLFLSPEGVVCDFGPRDRKYISECRDFCTELGYKPFEYVLTPRYKGLTCLVEQVKHGGMIVSVCMAFERDGVLLNQKLTSMDREIPDIYSLLMGIGGSPTNVYVDMKELHFTADDDIKKIMMEDYVRKDALMAAWHRALEEKGAEDFKGGFQVTQANVLEMNVAQLMHALIMIGLAHSLNLLPSFFNFCTALYLIIAFCHTLGWMMNGTSMESVPFESGIKAIVMFLFGAKHKEREKKKKA